jgi:hypothetical protein
MIYILGTMLLMQMITQLLNCSRGENAFSFEEARENSRPCMDQL